MGAAGHVPVAVCEIKTGILTALVFVDQKTADLLLPTWATKSKPCLHSGWKHSLSQSKNWEWTLDNQLCFDVLMWNSNQIVCLSLKKGKKKKEKDVIEQEITGKK